MGSKGDFEIGFRLPLIGTIFEDYGFQIVRRSFCCAELNIFIYVCTYIYIVAVCTYIYIYYTLYDIQICHICYI